MSSYSSISTEYNLGHFSASQSHTQPRGQCTKFQLQQKTELYVVIELDKSDRDSCCYASIYLPLPMYLFICTIVILTPMGRF